MKTMKKLTSLLLVLLMLVGMMSTAVWAQTQETSGGGDGTITIGNATKDATYTVYKLFDATYATMGEGEDAEPVAAYTIKKSADNSDWITDLIGTDSPFTLTQKGGNTPAGRDDANDTEYVVTLKDAPDGGWKIDGEDATSEEYVIWWLNQAGRNLPKEVIEVEAEDVEIKFTGLAYGYYLVTSSVNNGGTVTLTNLNSSAEIIDKNQKPGPLDKKITNGTVSGMDKEGNPIESAKIGDVITYTITYGTTNFDGENKVTEYIIGDILPAGMTLDETSVKVYVGEVNDDNLLTVGDNYTISFTDYNDQLNNKPGEDQKHFSVTIPWVEDWDGTKSPTAAYDADSLYESPSVITITYEAVLTDLSQIDSTGNTNIAESRYNTVKPDGTIGEPGTGEDSETVYTYALALKKVNKDGEALQGAEFALERKISDNPETWEPIYVKAVEGKEGYYVIDTSPAPGEDQEDTRSNIVVTPANGLIVIEGLDESLYRLTETKAPSGYNLLADSVEITPTLIGSTTTNTRWEIDENGEAGPATSETEQDVIVSIDDLAATDIVVVNLTGSLLPETGGIGTTIFYAVGGTLAVAAVILLITKRRMSTGK